MKNKKDYIIYDVINKENIFIKLGYIVETCKQLGFDHTTLSKLTVKKYIAHRYILPEAKDRIFTLVDIGTGKEYDCITNGTIFIHLNIPYSDNEAKYVYELRKRRQGKASICGKLFYLKGGKKSKITSKTKVLPNLIKNELQNCKLKRSIKVALHARIQKAISATNAYKSARTEELLGCKVDIFKKYIESKFTNSMGWHNRQLWHIDHIEPCNSFDLKNPKDQRKCFHYTNLQPIWKTTKVAEEMGETDYQGNQNKNDRGFKYDYIIVDKIQKKFQEMSKSEAKELAINLFNAGFRKVL